MKYPLRSMFVAPKGYKLIQLDLSQAETWVVAHLAKEFNMINALKTKDIHSFTCSNIFNIPYEQVVKDGEQRYLAKKSNHGFSYGMEEGRFTQEINKEAPSTGVSITLAQGTYLRKKWLELYNLESWWSDIQGELARSSRSIRTVYGRIRTFYKPWGKELFKEAYAFKPQSTVGDHALGAIQPEIGIAGGILAIWKHFKGTDVRVVQTAHDSVIVESPDNCINEVATVCRGYMQRPLLINGMEFTIPSDVEVGERWGEMQKVKLDS